VESVPARSPTRPPNGIVSCGRPGGGAGWRDRIGECSRKFYLLAALALLAAGCQPLGLPFAPDSKPPDNPLLQLENSAGIAVSPIAGMTEPRSRRLTASVAKALRHRNIPASAGGSRNRKSLLLRGHIGKKTEAGAPASILIEWDLLDSDGASLGNHRESIGEADWQAADSRLFERLAAGAAEKIVGLLRRQPKAAPPQPLAPALYVWPIDEAPGDSGQSLKRAIEAALPRVFVPLARTLSDASYVLLGSVRMEADRDASARVAVTWTILGPDGAEIGKVEQNNRVPAERLDGAWGQIARAVARDAARGIADLLFAVGKPRASLEASHALRPPMLYTP
jgi:hypothetical protein